MYSLLKQVVKTGIITEPAPEADEALRQLAQRLDEVVLKHFGRALAIRHVDAGSCNGCELEIHAANNAYYNLERLGIKGTIRTVDSAQYTRRLDGFDYDIVVGNFPQSHSPGNEQRDFWGSEAAGRRGSANLIGIRSPAIDTLIDRIIFAKDRSDLVAASRALDRVLLWNDYVVPQWYAPTVRIAYWDRYGQPKVLPTLDPGFLQVWWFDQTLAARLPSSSQL